jgi:hypothetical protein
LGAGAWALGNAAPGGATANAGQVAIHQLAYDTAPPLPSGFRTVSIEGDPTGAGVWLLAANEAQVDLFHWQSSSQTLRSWPVALAEDFTRLAGAPLAVAPDDSTVWVSSGPDIVSITPATGAVKTLAAPPEPASPLAENSLPPDLRNHPNVVGLAVSNTGNVAVAESAAAAVSVLDPSGHVVSSIPLPTNMAPSSVAYSSSDALAVPLIDYASAPTQSAVLVRASSGTSQVVHTPAEFVQPHGDSFLTGTISPMAISSVGSTTTAPSAVAAPAPPTSGPYRALLGSSPVFLPNGDSAYGTASGITVTNSQGSKSAALVLPTFSCPGVAVPYDSSSSGATSSTCHAYPVSMTADQAGNIWYQSSDPAADIGEITTSEYETDVAP